MRANDGDMVCAGGGPAGAVTSGLPAYTRTCGAA